MFITATSTCSVSAAQHAFLVINEVAIKALELLEKPHIPAIWLCHGKGPFESGASGVSACRIMMLGWCLTASSQYLVKTCYVALILQ